MKFLDNELKRVLSVSIPPNSTILFGPHQASELVDSLMPASTREFQPIPASKDSIVTHVLMAPWIDQVIDIYSELRELKSQLSPETRVVVVSVSRLWSRYGRRFNRVSKQKTSSNWIPPSEVVNLFELSGYEFISRRRAVLMPIRIPILSRLINKALCDLPILRHLSIFNIITFRPQIANRNPEPSVSVIVAARNEAGNIQNLVNRLPRLAPRMELIFVEGGSKDNTWDVIQEVIAKHTQTTEYSIRAIKQTGVGKGDAVRHGFANANGDIFIILDADLSVPPEELSQFIESIRNNHCEFANGSRLVYTMENKAMQFLNLIGNRLFGIAFTFLLGQSVRDTLCGTKALRASDYNRIAMQRSYFGEFDPFGDFDLLFGASRLGLKIRDIPVHYKERVYGSTNISRFRHGILLLRMTVVAARRLRFV